MFRVFFLSCVALAIASEAVSIHDNDLSDRTGNLQNRQLTLRKCNEKLGVVTADQVQAMGETYLESLVQKDRVERSRGILFRTAKYDFDVYKFCSSCRDIDDWYYERSERFPANYRDYCNETTYGYYNVSSMLVFLPRDPATDKLLSNTKLRVFLSLHASRARFGAEPTEAWPSNDKLKSIQNQTVLGPTYTQFVPGMLAASSGNIALFPDYHGYGESTLNRTYLWPTGYEQSAIVSYLHIQRYLANLDTPCTAVDNAVTLQGVEDGAFGAVFVAKALQQFEVRVLRVYSGAGIFDLDQLIADAVRRVDGGKKLGERLKQMLQLAAFSFSVDTPGFANARSNQDLVSARSRQKIIKENSPPVSKQVTPAQGGASVPAVASGLEVINPDLLSLHRRAFKQNISFPCRSDLVSPFSTIEKLCKAIATASALPILLSDPNATKYEWNMNLEVCYSEADPIVSPKQYEQLPNVEDDFIHFYDGPIGTDDDTLKPSGPNHQVNLDICAISSGLFFGLQGHTPPVQEDRPQHMASLDSETAQACGVSNSNPGGSVGSQNGMGNGGTSNQDNSSGGSDGTNTDGTGKDDPSSTADKNNNPNNSNTGSSDSNDSENDNNAGSGGATLPLLLSKTLGVGLTMCIVGLW